MYIFTCERTWEAMLTCIYDAWSSRLGQQNIRLEFEPVSQLTLFDTYTHVEADEGKAESVAEAVCRQISPYVYRELAYCSLAYEPDVLDNIYRVMLLGFAYGGNILDMVQFRDVARNREIRTRFGKESCHFKEIVRFHEVGKALYVAHLEPKSSVLLTIAPYFQDRMPSENWMIVDDVHHEAIVHKKDEEFYMQKLTEDELARLLKTEEMNDGYTDLWKVFFEAISIKERENYVCQRSHFSLWSRKHAVEFMK